LVNCPAREAVADARVKSAADAPEAAAGREEFNLPLAILLSIEEIALSHPPLQ
jgi:hypothetical protein